MKKKRTVTILTHNWQLKLLAIVTAVFLWLYVGMTHNMRIESPRPAKSPVTVTNGVLETNGK